MRSEVRQEPPRGVKYVATLTDRSPGAYGFRNDRIAITHSTDLYMMAAPVNSDSRFQDHAMPIELYRRMILVSGLIVLLGLNNHASSQSSQTSQAHRHIGI